VVGKHRDRLRHIASAAGLSILVAVGAEACVIEPGYSSSTGLAVSGPPPEPLEDARQRPVPAPGLAWIAGYWHWTGMQYTWIPGHFERPPAGTRWRLPRYSMREGIYFYEPGGWSPQAR